MEEKNLTEKESLELIAKMIENTKNRIRVGDGNILLIWGYVSVLTALVVWVVLMLTANPLCNFLWFLIPVVGVPLHLCMQRKDKAVPAAKTYVDRISAGIWNIVSWVAFIAAALCVGFTLWGGHWLCWNVMLVYAFVLIGFCAAATGVVIRERSLVVGGLVSITAGGFVACWVMSGLMLSVTWIIPLYIVCYALMMIVPGHIINRKAKKSCPKN